MMNRLFAGKCFYARLGDWKIQYNSKFLFKANQINAKSVAKHKKNKACSATPWTQSTLYKVLVRTVQRNSQAKATAWSLFFTSKNDNKLLSQQPFSSNVPTSFQCCVVCSEIQCRMYIMRSDERMQVSQ